jgi:hypothetical protein
MWAQAAALLLTASPATAQPRELDRERARELANRAADAVARGEHAVAEQLLTEAYREYPAPTIALLHARTLLQLRRLAGALNAYRRAATTGVAAHAPAAWVRAVEEARREALELEPRVPRLRVAVSGAATDAHLTRVTLDHQPLSSAQRAHWIFVDPGRHVVRVEHAGRSSEKIVRLEERQSSAVEIEIPRPATLARVATITALGVGTGGLVVGIVTGVLASSAHSSARAKCSGARCPSGSAGARDIERFRSLRVYSTIGYGIGAAGLGAGGFLLLRGSFDGPRLEIDLDQAALPNGSAL